VGVSMLRQAQRPQAQQPQAQLAPTIILSKKHLKIINGNQFSDISRPMAEPVEAIGLR